MSIAIRPAKPGRLLMLMLAAAVLVTATPPALADEPPAQVPEEIMALLDEPGPEIQIACKFVEIERDPDNPLEIDWTDYPDAMAMLRKLLSEGRAQIIIAPRVTTKNNVPAEISFSTEIPYFYATITYDQFGKRTVEHESDTATVAQWLSVKPLILADGSIQMDVEFRFDKEVSEVVGPEGEVIPIVATESGTVPGLRVADGDTTVIGGLLSPRKVLDDEGVEQTKAVETLILLTPKILTREQPEDAITNWSGPIAGETRDGEQWVWDKIPLKYTDAAAIAPAFGGSVVSTAAASLPEGRRPVSTVGPPRRGGFYGPKSVGTPKLMLPTGMAPPVGILQQNVLLLHGTQEAIAQFREILSYFDKPAKQIEIAVKFVEVDMTEGKPFGIDWFNLGFAPGEGITVGRFRPGTFEKELRDLVAQGRARIINEPRVTTQNNMPTQVSFSTETLDRWVRLDIDATTGQRAPVYHEEALSLRYSLYVTPRILEDGAIVLDLEAEIQDQVGTIMGPEDERWPVVTTQAAYAQVRVPDGDTVVIAGLVRSDKIFAPRGPSGEETPIIGDEFRSKLQAKPNKELLIFVTPRIIGEIPPR